jgi:hypothetical protein
MDISTIQGECFETTRDHPEILMPSSIQVFASVSPWFYKKENHAQTKWNEKKQAYTNDWAYGAFTNTVATLEQLQGTIEAGKAIAAGHFKDNWRKEANFEQSNVLFVDIDNKVYYDEHDKPIRRRIRRDDGKMKTVNYVESPMSDEEARELMRHPLIVNYAGIVQESASSKPGDRRFHVLFFTNKIVTDPYLYKSYTRRLQSQFRRADPSVRDAARMLYSSTTPCIIAEERTIPVSLIETWSDPRRSKQQVKPAKTPFRPTKKQERLVIEALQHIPPEPKNLSYSDWFRIIAAIASSFSRETAVLMLEDWTGHCSEPGEIEAKVDSVTNGYDGEPATLGTLFWIAEQYGYRPGYRPQIKADIIFEAEYVNQGPDLPKQGVVCVISDKGTGKTEWSSEVIQQYRQQADLPRICVITPFITLTQSASERYQVECYLGLNQQQRRQTQAIAITAPSLEHLVQPESATSPKYDVLVFDEFSKILAALNSQELFKHGAATRVLSILKRLIKNAKCVVVTDADLGSIEIRWLKSIRKDVTVALNTYRRDYGDMRSIHSENSEAIDTLLMQAVAEGKGTVYAVSDTKGVVETWHEVFKKRYGDEHVLAIHGGNSNNKRQRTFMRDPSAETGKYRVVLGTSSIMTGIDIQSQVYQTFGSFLNQNIDASGLLQMLARARNTGLTTVWIKSKQRKQATRASTIYKRAKQRAQGTATLCSLDENGNWDFDGTTKEISQLQAVITARRNRSLNDLEGDFLQKAARNYRIIHVDDNLPTGTKAEMCDARQELKERREKLRLTAPPLSPQDHQQKQVKGECTETDNAGLYRWQLEDFYQQEISPELLDFDREGRGRQELSQYIETLKIPPEELMGRDRFEQHDKTPFGMRKHFAKRQQVLQSCIAAGWDSLEQFTPEIGRTEQEWIERFSPFLQEHLSDIYSYFGGRQDHVDKPLAIVRRLLRCMGLSLEEVRSRNKDEPKHYRLHRARLEQMEKLAQIQLAGLETKTVSEEDQERVRYKNP